MRKVVVSDTNIFIDLISMGLIGDFFLLPFDISTVDFVIRELKKSGQKDVVMEFEARKKLTVFKFSESEIEDIFNLKMSAKGNVSFQDCSIWYCAKKMSACILTGDRTLTTRARADEIEVRGLLYVMDQIVTNGIIPPKLAAERLRELTKENKRLPEKSVEEYTLKWLSLTLNNDEADVK